MSVCLYVSRRTLALTISLHLQQHAQVVNGSEALILPVLKWKSFNAGAECSPMKQGLVLKRKQLKGMLGENPELTIKKTALPLHTIRSNSKSVLSLQRRLSLGKGRKKEGKFFFHPPPIFVRITFKALNAIFFPGRQKV